MAQYADGLRIELQEILDKLQEIYRKQKPSSVLLFSSEGQTLASGDVALSTAQLVLRDDPQRKYDVYLHGFQTGNLVVGKLETKAVTGRIDVGYHSGETHFEFVMHLGFGARVSSYDVIGKEGVVHAQHTKHTVMTALEQVLRIFARNPMTLGMG